MNAAKRGAKKSGAGWIKLTHEVVDGEAFGAASNNARCLLILLWRRHNGKNNGAIELSIREAAAWLHTSKATAARAFIELQALGLVAAVRRGHFNIKAGAQKGEATTWRLLVIPQEGDGAHA